MSIEKAAPNVDSWQSALGGASATEEALSSTTEDPEDVVRAENSTVDDQESEGKAEDTLKDLPLSSKEPASSKPKEVSAKEVITVTDDQGRRRKVEIDYSNREAIKQAHLQAAGMRKYQAERDQALQGLKSREGRLKELESNFSALDSAYQNGVEGLFDLLEGRRGAFKEHIAKAVDRSKFLESASPRELEEFNAREETEKLRRDHQKLMKDNEDFKKKISEERETTELKETQSRVYPSFNKHRFADKLGNPEDENMFDEMLWNTTLKRLEPYEKQGLDLSPELIDREFNSVASSIRARIRGLADKQVSKVVEQKKQEATENVQAKVKSGYTGKSDLDKIKDMDTGSIFKNWGSISKILNPNKR